VHRLDPYRASGSAGLGADPAISTSDFDVSLLVAPIAPAHRSTSPISNGSPANRLPRRRGAQVTWRRSAFGFYLTAIVLVCVSLGAWQTYWLLRSSESGRNLLERAESLVERLPGAP
jgi:hypothetical protein